MLRIRRENGKMEDKSIYYRFNLDTVLLNVLALPLFFVVYVPVGWFFKDKITIFNMGFFLFWLLLWMILHEICHGIGFHLSKNTSYKDITYGIKIEKGIFYCMCKSAINKRDILISLMFPFVWLGIVPLILGMVMNNFCLCLLSCVNISGAIGDLLMFNFMRKLPKDIRYIDVDDCLGFTILSSVDISKVRGLGIKFVKSGEFDKEKEITDYRKIVISKVSIAFLVIFVLLIGIGLII